MNILVSTVDNNSRDKMDRKPFGQHINNQDSRRDKQNPSTEVQRFPANG